MMSSSVGMKRPQGWNPVPVWHKDEKFDDWRRKIALWRDSFPPDVSNKMLVAQIISSAFEKRSDHLVKICFEWYEAYDFALHDAEMWEEYREIQPSPSLPYRRSSQTTQGCLGQGVVAEAKGHMQQQTVQATLEADGQEQRELVSTKVKIIRPRDKPLSDFLLWLRLRRGNRPK